MNPVTLLSGASEDECRRMLGESIWAMVGQSWRDPDTLAGDCPAELAGAELVWLYHSPAMELLQASPLIGVEDILNGWARRNRAVLNLRQACLSRLVAVNIGVATSADLTRAWPALAGMHSDEFPAPVAGAELVKAIEWLLCWSAPDPREVYDSLEAAAITGLHLEGDGLYADSDALLLLVDVVRKGSAPSFPAPLAAAVAQPVLQEAERQKTRAENLSRQLQQVRDELDLCYLHSRKVEQALADRETAWNDSRVLREHAHKVVLGEEELLFQLQSAQEELELQQQDSQQQSRALKSECERRTRAEKSLETVCSEQARARDEIRDLRMRLDCLLSEVRTQTTLPAHFVPMPGPLMRFRDKLRRHTLGRINPRWAQPTPDTGRARALEDLAASPWFDRIWYSEQYTDVAAAGIDAVQHYYDHGWSEGRDPGPYFSGRFYLDTYPDAAASGMVPLLHFIRFGLKEGHLTRAP